MKTSKFLSLTPPDWLKTFWMFLISTVVSVAGDAIMQAYKLGSYSLANIHWTEIGLTILVAVIAYIQKALLTNSKDEFLKKDPKDN
jgi:hypothetical protein